MDSQTLAKELYGAIANAETKLAIEILENNPFLLMMETPNGSWLHVAAKHGNLEIVKYLCESNLDLNASGGFSESKPIDLANSNEHNEVVKYFLEKGAILDVIESERKPVFSAIHKGQFELVKLRIENEIEVGGEYGTMNAISFAEELMNNEIIHESVIKHLRNHFEKINELSLMEIIGDLLIHIIPSSFDRDYIIIATSGAKIHSYNEKYELLMYLPANWNLSELNDLNNNWPITWLRQLANYDQNISPENTFSNEDINEPLAPNTKLSSFIVLLNQNEYGKIVLPNGEKRFFLDLIPLYKEEIEFKQKFGTIQLLKCFEENGITSVLNINRINVGINTNL